jgi:hypothetical protein
MTAVMLVLVTMTLRKQELPSTISGTRPLLLTCDRDVQCITLGNSSLLTLTLKYSLVLQVLME